MPKPVARRGSAVRGRGSYRPPATRRDQAEIINKVLYPKAVNERNARGKYRGVYSRDQDRTASTCIVTLPSEKEIKTLTKKFIRTYYKIFDQPSRTNLETLYHKDALFSFSSTHPLPGVGRNLILVRDPAERLNMLVFENTNIARTLASFAPTEHLVDHLAVDVSFYVANPMAISCFQLVVTGVFKDTSVAIDPLRAFTRVFALKHTNTDNQGEPIYKIFNDMFMLQMPTQDQIKRYHQNAQADKKSYTFQQSQRSTNSNITAGAGGLFTKRRKEQCIESIMSRTQLTREGAEQLLSDCNWDEEQSLGALRVAMSKNEVPPEFFRK